MISAENFATSLNAYFKLLNRIETIEPFTCPRCESDWWRVEKSKKYAKCICHYCGYTRSIGKKDYKAFMVEKIKG